MCTSTLRQKFAGRCGCGGDLAAGDTVIVGRAAAAWGQREPMCVNSVDVGSPVGRHRDPHVAMPAANGTLDNTALFDVEYDEVNTGELASLYIEAGFVNTLSWDGALVATSQARPRLALGETRRAAFRGVRLARDHRLHTLTLQLNVNTQREGGHWTAEAAEMDRSNNQVCVCVFGRAGRRNAGVVGFPGGIGFARTCRVLDGCRASKRDRHSQRERGGGRRGAC